MQQIHSNEDVLVNVVMVTYNQEKYITQAIESVLRQSCLFKYRLIISDDGSGDNTKEICRNYCQLYPDKIIFVDNDQNVGLVKNYKRAFDLCTGKYIAILEGDDYWIDNYKLQKQVLILEKYPDVGMVHGNTYILSGNILNKSKSRNKKYLEGNIFKKLILNNSIYPLTVLFRKELYERHIDYNLFIENNFRTIDYALWLGIAANSKIKYVKDYLSVYRIEIGSISNVDSFEKAEKFMETAYFVQKYYCKKYNLNQRILRNAQNNIHYSLLSTALSFNDFKSAKKYGILFKPNSLVGLVKKIVCLNSCLFVFYNKIRNERFL